MLLLLLCMKEKHFPRQLGLNACKSDPGRCGRHPPGGDPKATVFARDSRHSARHTCPRAARSDLARATPLPVRVFVGAFVRASLGSSFRCCFVFLFLSLAACTVFHGCLQQSHKFSEALTSIQRGPPLLSYSGDVLEGQLNGGTYQTSLPLSCRLAPQTAPCILITSNFMLASSTKCSRGFSSG